ncbi:MAG: CapA family protein [Clostridia bacterium]|nr:CapA family protein [Clostridia bacterium]
MMKNKRSNPHFPKPKPSAILGVFLLALLTAGTVLYTALSSRNTPDPLPSLAPDVPAEGISRAIAPDEPDVSPQEIGPVSVRPDPVQSDPVRPETVDWAGRLADAAASLPVDPACPIGDFTACLPSIDPASAEAVIREEPQTAAAFRAAFKRVFGVTPLAYQMQPGAQDPSDRGSLVFTGDINFADDWYSMDAYRTMGSDITKNIPDPLLGILRSADLCVMNCEFSMSLRGAPLEGKYYTFRADPAHAALFQTLGCDLVTLANNHVYDYGRDAFLDTLDTLDAAGIARIGAGRTLEEAKAYRAFIIGGAKIGFVAASNAEIYRMTPGATAEDPGVLLMYDPAEFCSALDRARAECDFVCAVVHWGTENSTEINDNQREYAALFAAHGAGLIVGHHPHVLQPVETTAGIPVAYSLGNFWFNLAAVDTGVLWVDLNWDDTRGVTPEVTFIPCVQENGVTNVAEP